MCRIMHSWMSLFSMPSCSWVTHDTTPSVYASRFMHPSCSVHSYIWVGTWNTILNTEGLPLFCVVVWWWWLCVCDFLIRKVSDRAALFTEFSSVVFPFPWESQTSTQPDNGRELTGELCVSVCWTVKKLTANICLHLNCNIMHQFVCVWETHTHTHTHTHTYSPQLPHPHPHKNKIKKTRCWCQCYSEPFLSFFLFAEKLPLKGGNY